MTERNLTFVFRNNYAGDTNWTTGKNCEAEIVEINGVGFVRLRPKKQDRPWDTVLHIPVASLDHISENVGYVPSPEVVPEAVVHASENGPRRGRSPKAAVTPE